MSLQYISDTFGHHAAVVIPIEEWNKIIEKYEDLKKLMITEDIENRPKYSEYLRTSR